jgi:hypothetical protein
VAPDPLGILLTEARPLAFVPEVREPAMHYASLSCRCGGNRFRLSGWLTVSAGKGGFFWRSLTRVWREARQSISDGRPNDSPFKLPILVRCDACERAVSILDCEALGEWLPTPERMDPRESLRCRICGRGSFELVVGLDGEGSGPSLRAVEVVSRCHRCHRQECVAWSRSTRSDQEISLDLLYGRR